MNRRHFLTLASIGAIGSSALRSSAASPGSAWQPDGAGSQARIGLLTPDDDPVPESEMWAMSPPGVSIHASRVPWNGEARSFAEHSESAVELLARLTPRVILYGFTSSSYVLGAEADNLLRARLEKRVDGVPVVFTCVAASEALRILGVHRVALIHPPWFSEDVNGKGMDYFQARGFEVVSSVRIAPARTFKEVPPEEVFERTKTNTPRRAEAVLP